MQQHLQQMKNRRGTRKRKGEEKKKKKEKQKKPSVLDQLAHDAEKHLCTKKGMFTGSIPTVKINMMT